jgi:uncharacterized protein
MRTSRVLITAALIGAAVVPISLLASPVAAETPTELFFSEYIEGTSNNKALEIHNGTGTPVDLTAGGYNVQMFFNGNPAAGLTINLTGSVATDDVFVLAQASADPAILAQADQTNGAGWFNGDDAVVLRRGTTVIDVIGQIGFDPGSEWGTGLTSTADNTLRRKADVCAGDLDGTDVFDPAVEWDGFATNTFDGLGSHTTMCEGRTPVINEFVANHVGNDTNEYIEVFGSPSTDLSAYTILQIEGDFSGTATGVVDSATVVGTTNAAGFWTTGFSNNVFENGTLTLLLVENFTGAVGNDLDTNDDGVLDVTPWDAVVDAVAVSDGGANDLTYGVPVLTPGFDGGIFTVGGASRIPDGLDTDTTADWLRNNFGLSGLPGFDGNPVAGEALNTPNAPNVAYEPPPPPAEVCGDPFTPIPAIQGSGLSSPMVGQTVSTEGIVVGRFQNGPNDTIFVQDPIGDGDPATSDGIYVNANAAGIPTGAAVRIVGGSVTEFFTRTQLNGITELLVCDLGADAVEPTELTLPVTTLADFERYEAMLVTFPQPLVISEFFNFGRFGEIVLTTDRQFQPTAVFEPGSIAAADLAAAHLLSRITLDDGRSSQNPDPALHPNGLEFTLDNLFRGGDEVSNVTGALDYSFNLWRIQPTKGADYTATNPRPSVPDVGGDIQVASFNVLNYFTTFNPPGRGANNDAELLRQEAKIVAAIAEMDADVVGLIEIENNDAAIQRLVGALNDEVGAGTYEYIDTGVIGTDAIKVAFIYRPAAVELVGDYAVLDSSVDERFNDSRNRPALAQTFRAIGDDGAFGVPFTATVNHLKSKGSACTPDDPDTGDGSGNCNLTRTAAAEAIVDWLASDPTDSGSDTHLVIGDLNAYDKETPIDALLAGGYTDLLAEFQGEFAYTYVFNGQLGYLDHALANDGLVGAVTGTDAWLINADEASLIDYDLTFKQQAQQELFAPDPFRSSDHDPVLVGLDVCAVDTAPTLDVSVTPETLRPPNHKYRTVEATVTAADAEDGDVTVELVSVTSNEPDNALGNGDGNTVNDIVVLDDTTFLLRAERAGRGDGRVYTITYSVTDSCGATTTATAEVTVPK